VGKEAPSVTATTSDGTSPVSIKHIGCSVTIAMRRLLPKHPRNGSVTVGLMRNSMWNWTR
jgi:hypothetical protein